MRYLWMLMLIGCETMTDPGSPFKSVLTTQPVSSDVPAEDVFFDEPEVLSSEMLQEGGALPDAAPAVPAITEPVLLVEPAVPQAPAEVVSSPAAPPQAAAVAAPIAAVTWPIRLVSTLPDSQPPRAILGLSDGRELVVSPGTMLPEQGLVVISIGPQSAELARVVPAGDHALIQPLSLQAQF